MLQAPAQVAGQPNASADLVFLTTITAAPPALPRSHTLPAGRLSCDRCGYLRMYVFHSNLASELPAQSWHLFRCRVASRRVDVLF